MEQNWLSQEAIAEYFSKVTDPQGALATNLSEIIQRDTITRHFWTGVFGMIGAQQFQKTFWEWFWAVSHIVS
jgi:phenylalanine-4-hydroxylase